MTNEQQAKSLPDQLRELAVAIEEGKIKNVAVCIDTGWSGAVENPFSLITVLFDAMCSLREMGKAAAMQKQMEEEAKNAPRIQVPGHMKLQ